MEEYYFYTEGLTVGYHGVPLIKNIKISLKKGEILTLIGLFSVGESHFQNQIPQFFLFPAGFSPEYKAFHAP